MKVNWEVVAFFGIFGTLFIFLMYIIMTVN